MLKALILTTFLALGAVLYFVHRQRRTVHRASVEVRDRLMAELEPVWGPLYAGREPSCDDIERFASDPRTRISLFDLLLFHHKLSAFPAAYRTVTALAESQLVGWLMHPNELGSSPAEIALSTDVVLEHTPDSRRRWLLFQFRATPPHPASADGWLAGVVGPVPTVEQEAFPDAPVVWSSFKPISAHSPGEHVALCRDLALKTGVTL